MNLPEDFDVVWPQVEAELVAEADARKQRELLPPARS
jgi:hypothetical protein